MFSDIKLEGRNVAILATDGFEGSELFSPKEALERAGAEADVVSLKSGSIKSWGKDGWGQSIEVDLTLEDADPNDYEALLLPGGVMNPDHLRNNPKAIAFAQAFVDSGKPIAAICHGPQLLIETGILRGRRVTSWPSVKTDMINAGAEWEDSEVVTDRGLVTSRKPADIPAFSKKMIEEFAEGPHQPTPSKKAQEELRH